jgi:hypothetical protein
VLLGRPREVGAAGRGRAACPQQVFARLDLGREDLVLEIAVGQSDAPNEVEHLFRFGDVAGERFLARNALERPLAGLDRVHELLDVLDARVVRPA